MNSLQRIQEHYEQARSLNASDRENYLRELQQQSPTLAEEVASLLAVDSSAALADQPLVREESLLGQQLGPYTIERELGRGGMGRVYLASQEGTVQRSVAIKVIAHWGLDETSRKRFEFEQLVLAKMSHSYIARLFESAFTPDGQPYFVMENVEGEPLSLYATRNKLDLLARIDLFTKVCEGVAHAHLKGILHRDLKPGNILVVEENGQPIPKIIDFGIARSLLEHQQLTRTHQPTGTWCYMSPEQVDASLGEQDFRMDVYALGATFYELLVGRPPFTWPIGTSALTIYRDICSKEPDKPWFALQKNTAAGINLNYASSQERIAKHLQTDLGWVVLKALEKNPDRRYESVLHLRDDIQRFRQGELVTARRPTWRYALGKFIGRHKAMVSLASSAMLLCFSLLIFAILQRNTARAEQANALHQSAMSERVVSFFVAALGEADPYQGQGYSVTARDILDNSQARLATDLKEEPEVRARLMATLGEIYGNYGVYDKGRDLLQQAISQQKLAGQEQQAIDSLERLAAVHLSNYAIEDAEAAALQVTNARLETGSELDLAKARTLLADVYFAKSQYEEGLTQLDLSAPILARHADPNIQISALIARANCQIYLRHFDKAQEALTQASAIDKTKQGVHHQIHSSLEDTWAKLYMNLGDYPKALLILDNFLAEELRLFGERNWRHAISYSSLGMLYQHLGHNQEALCYYYEALNLLDETLSQDHFLKGENLIYLGYLKTVEGQTEGVETLLLRAVSIFQKTVGDLDVNTFNAHQILGVYYIAQADPRARIHLEEAIALGNVLFGPNSSQVAVSENTLARHFINEEDLDQALAYSQSALGPIIRDYGEKDPLLARVDHQLGDIYLKLGRAPEALPHFQRAVSIRREPSAGSQDHLIDSLLGLATAYMRVVQPSKSVGTLQEAAALVEKSLPVDHPKRQQVQTQLANSLALLEK